MHSLGRSKDVSMVHPLDTLIYTNTTAVFVNIVAKKSMTNENRSFTRSKDVQTVLNFDKNTAVLP